MRPEDFTLAARLRRVEQLRKSRGVTHEACAHALGYKTHTQYLKREQGLSPFTDEQLEQLREFLRAPVGWPFLSSEDAYLLAQLEHSRSSGGAPTTNPQFAEYLSHRAVAPEVVDEMQRRANFDHGRWETIDFELVRVIAERWLALYEKSARHNRRIAEELDITHRSESPPGHKVEPKPPGRR